MNESGKGKIIDENLEAIPDCAKKTLTSCLGTVTNQTWSIDANGNITATVSGTSDSDGKIARENAERKAKGEKDRQKKRRLREGLKRKRQKKKPQRNVLKKHRQRNRLRKLVQMR